MLVFGRSREIERQWRLLGALLCNTGLIEATDFLDAACGSRLVPWLEIRSWIAEGHPLSTIVEQKISARTPRSVLADIRRGEAEGDLPAALEAGLDRQPGPEGSTPVAEAVNAILLEAIQLGAAKIAIAAPGKPELPVRFLVGEEWRPATAPPLPMPETFGRICVMASLPYWSKPPLSGRLSLRVGVGPPVQLRVQIAQDRALLVEIEPRAPPGD